MARASESQHIVAAIVENKPGVLFKVSGMFRRRNFNIESITVGPIDDGRLARMTIVVRGDEGIVEQLIKQLGKIVEVIRVSRLDPSESVFRELALVKVHASESRARSDIVNFARIFRGRIVDVSSDSMTIEITGDPDKIEAFLSLVRSYGIKEVARTGITALSRGARAIRPEAG